MNGNFLPFFSYCSIEIINFQWTPASFQHVVSALPSLAAINAQHIRQALKMSGGKINGPGGAAEILGINPSTLLKRMDKLGSPYGRRSWVSPL